MLELLVHLVSQGKKHKTSTKKSFRFGPRCEAPNLPMASNEEAHRLCNILSYAAVISAFINRRPAALTLSNIEKDARTRIHLFLVWKRTNNECPVHPTAPPIKALDISYTFIPVFGSWNPGAQCIVLCLLTAPYYIKRTLSGGELPPPAITHKQGANRQNYIPRTDMDVFAWT